MIFREGRRESFRWLGTVGTSGSGSPSCSSTHTECRRCLVNGGQLNHKPWRFCIYICCWCQCSFLQALHYMVFREGCRRKKRKNCALMTNQGEGGKKRQTSMLSNVHVKFSFHFHLCGQKLSATCRVIVRHTHAVQLINNKTAICDFDFRTPIFM